MQKHSFTISPILDSKMMNSTMSYKMNVCDNYVYDKQYRAENGVWLHFQRGGNFIDPGNDVLYSKYLKYNQQ